MLNSVNPLAQGIVLAVIDLETAQREYDACLARCPATHQQAWDNPALYPARMLWIEEKAQCANRLAIAKGFAASGWTQEGQKVAVRIQPMHHHSRKSVEELVACYQEKYAFLCQEASRTPKWASARAQIYQYKALITERCKEDQVPMPYLAPVPPKPPTEGPKKLHSLKPLTGDPLLDERRRRNREAKRARRNQVSSDPGRVVEVTL